MYHMRIIKKNNTIPTSSSIVCLGCMFVGEVGVGAISRLFLQSAKNILKISYILSSRYYLYYPQYILKSVLNILSIYVSVVGVGAIFRLFFSAR